LELGISLSDPLQKNENSITYINEKIQQSELDNYFIQSSQNLLNFGNAPNESNELSGQDKIEKSESKPIKNSSNSTEIQCLREENR
jgi:hypothetical protein